MRKKLQNRSGFTLVEMLAATLVLALLAVAMSAGLASAVKIYRQSVFFSNSEILQDTVDSAFSDLLRFASDGEQDGEDAVTFRNIYYNVQTGGHFTLREGRVYLVYSGEPDAKTAPLVNAGAYAGLQISQLGFLLDGESYIVNYTIRSADGAYSRDCEFVCRSVG